MIREKGTDVYIKPYQSDMWLYKNMQPNNLQNLKARDGSNGRMYGSGTPDDPYVYVVPNPSKL